MATTAWQVAKWWIVYDVQFTSKGFQDAVGFQLSW